MDSEQPADHPLPPEHNADSAEGGKFAVDESRTFASRMFAEFRSSVPRLEAPVP